jgi:hypothetical protein
MKATTMARYAQIHRRACEIMGTMPAMEMYAILGSEFALSEERIRKILPIFRKKPP